MNMAKQLAEQHSTRRAQTRSGEARRRGDGQEWLSRVANGMDPEGLARALGWFSIGLGLAEVTAPRRFARAIGVPERTGMAIMACRSGCHVSVIGVYGRFGDKIPLGSLMNRSLTVKTGQAHVQRYMRPLLERIQNGEIDPSFVISHRMQLEDAPQGYDTFLNKEDECMKVVLKPAA
jgi:threonine dehydrogenase-like Zn-dependent dehydrogenase